MNLNHDFVNHDSDFSALYYQNPTISTQNEIEALFDFNPQEDELYLGTHILYYSISDYAQGAMLVLQNAYGENSFVIIEKTSAAVLREEECIKGSAEECPIHMLMGSIATV